MRSKPGRPSTYILRILASVFYGLAPNAWVRERVEVSGFKTAMQCCIDRGMLTAEHQITDYGLRMLGRHAEGRT